MRLQLCRLSRDGVELGLGRNQSSGDPVQLRGRIANLSFQRPELILKGRGLCLFGPDLVGQGLELALGGVELGPGRGGRAAGPLLAAFLVRATRAFRSFRSL